MDDKFAIAVVLSDHKDDMLFAKRSSTLSEYKGFWSLPSMVVSKEEYDEILRLGSVPNDAQKRLWNKCFIGNRSIKLKFIRAGIRQRTDYLLKMALVGGKISSLPEPNKKKYSNTAFLAVLDILQRQNFQVGTCVSLFIQEMVEQAKIDSALSYLEVSPDLADSKISINEISSEELWLKALPNYLLLNAGESGSDGALIKKYTLDRFLRNYTSTLESKNSTILDLGCGGADFVHHLVSLGFEAIGVDLYPDPTGKFSCHENKSILYQCKAENVHEILEKESISLVLMNLVAQWTHDLQDVARSIKKIIQKKGRVLITIVPPEYSKNGHWDLVEDDYNWVVTESLRREPFLVMINRTIGPVRYYPRSTPDYISAFTNSGFLCSNSQYIYIDSLMNNEEISNLFTQRPDLRRHAKIPVFLILEFILR